VPQYSVINPQALMNGEPEDISVIRANLEAISQVLAGLDDSNIAAGANIQLSKIALGGGFNMAGGNFTSTGVVQAGGRVSGSRLAGRQGANLQATNGHLVITNGLHIIAANPGNPRISYLDLDVGSAEPPDGDIVILVNRTGLVLEYDLLGNLMFSGVGVNNDIYPHAVNSTRGFIYILSENKWQMLLNA
jgi:hypothetical protein